jgi:pimeloyl-ACP methyl ester carboxylesterase
VPDLHVETRGEGPLVVLAPGVWSPPATFTPLLDDLAADHKVLTYDARGTGQSERVGPYDVLTDVEDMAEVVAAQSARPATVLGVGAGSIVGLQLMSQRADLVDAVICPSGSPVNREVARGEDSIAGSRSVFDMLSEQAQRDFRGFLHSIVTSTNPQLDDAGVLERVNSVTDYTTHEAMLTRLRAWLSADAVGLSRAAGDRLWIFLYGNDAWSSSNAAPATRELLPEAHVLEVEDGPLSRPDITAAIVRRRTGVAA